jgi:hypothetical protein
MVCRDGFASRPYGRVVGTVLLAASTKGLLRTVLLATPTEGLLQIVDL